MSDRNEYVAARERLYELVDECGLSRAEAKLFREAIGDVDRAAGLTAEPARPTPPPPSDETFHALTAAHAQLKTLVELMGGLGVPNVQKQVDRCFMAALEHATSAAARRGESAWEVAARAAADKHGRSSTCEPCRSGLPHTVPDDGGRIPSPEVRDFVHHMADRGDEVAPTAAIADTTKAGGAL